MTQKQAKLTLAEVEQMANIAADLYAVDHDAIPNEWDEDIEKLLSPRNLWLALRALLASQTALREAVETLEKVYPEHDVEHLRAALLNQGGGDAG